MSLTITLHTPLNNDQIRQLHAGDRVLINGFLIAARDAAHKKLLELLQQGLPLPFDIAGQLVYYVGPTPQRPGHIIGSAGPTTAGRMDRFAPELLRAGAKGMIGKGEMGIEVKEALQRYCGVYLAATGGTGALLAQKIKTNEIVAYPELGTEAVRRLQVKDFPAIVAQDCFGGNVFKLEPEK